MDEEKHATGVPVRIHNEGSRLRAHTQTKCSRPGESAALEALYDRYAARVLGVGIKVIGSFSKLEISIELQGGSLQPTGDMIVLNDL